MGLSPYAVGHRMRWSIRQLIVSWEAQIHSRQMLRRAWWSSIPISHIIIGVRNGDCCDSRVFSSSILSSSFGAELSCADGAILGRVEPPRPRRSLRQPYRAFPIFVRLVSLSLLPGPSGLRSLRSIIGHIEFGISIEALALKAPISGR
jgi:hypothetical protein